jgi:predicted Rossmann fold nucleotide-binding protein DprA/Smf involved in DNA uptake
VYDLLRDGPLHIDAIIVQSALGGGRAASTLVGLEMKGVVRQLQGKVFERKDAG